MAGRAKKSTGRKAAKRSEATVKVRFANEGTMAKNKSGGHKGKGKSRGRKKNPGKHPRRRRRNPATFMGSLGTLLGAGAVALVTGAAVLAAQSKWAQPSVNASTGASTPNNVALYGIPAAGVVLAALIAKKAPTIAAGMATGAVAGPFALPLFSKVSSAATPAPAQTAAATHAALSAVELGALGWTEPMGSVTLGSQAAYYG